MFRKIISALLLLIILGSFTPVVPVANAAATGGGETLEIDQACIDAGNSFSGEIGGFVISNILWGVSFMAVDMLTSFLETLTIFGFNVGGIFEPFDQAMNFMRDIWMKSLIYGVIASVFNWFAGSLIESAMVLNLTLTADNALVAYGGKIILQIANFGFVIAIIFVGIATILRLKKDELSANKLLIKLIVGIILVNLTIPIASAIADLGTRVTMAMYKASSPCPENITKHFTVWSLKAKIMNLLGESAEGTGMVPPTDDPEFSIGEGDEEDDSGLSEDERNRLNEQKDKVDDQASAFTGLAGGLALDFLSMIVAAVLSLIAALTFLTFGAFLIIRFVILMLLLTFSPLIWFGFIFKDLKLGKSGNIWSAWWGQFLKWTFFGPVIVLFLAFVSEYLNVAASSSPLISASSQLSAVPAGVELFGIAQLIAVIIIAAMGIFLAAKFSGVAGSLAIAAATGGLGFVAGKAQGILKRGQMSTQMRAEQLKAQGRGNSLSAKALRLSSKGLGQAATGASLSGGASALLKQVGVKPNVNVPTDDEIRKGIIEKRMTRPIGGGTQRAKISIGEGGKTKIFGKEFTTSAGVKDTSENVLSLTQNDIKNMSADAKKEATAAIRKVQDKYIANNSALKTKQVVALRKLEKAMSTELTDHILGGLDLADPTKNPESALGLSNANLANIGKEGGMEEKEKVDHAIAQMGMGFSSLTPDQQKEYTRLRTKVDLLQKKGEW